MRNMKVKKKSLYILVTITAAFSLAGLVYGSWVVQQNTDNFLTMASYKARIVEKYKVPQHVDPSEEIEKRVEVRNEGSVDILVRVSVKKAFGERMKDGSFREDRKLNTDVIEIQYNDTYWEMRDDGWFYYKEILKSGETTKEPLMKSYILSAETGNEYKGKEAQIVVTMESVQAEGNAVSLWNMKLQDLGIVWREALAASSTKVTFLGQEQGFEVTAENTDLFAAFKNLLPGCARLQKVVIDNASSGSAEIYLRAQDTQQMTMSEEKRELVRKLLEEYAMIEVTDGERMIYQGAVCGKDSRSSMRSDISLGVFPAGSSKEMNIKLSLSPEMDNRFLELIGKVIWTFTAVGEDGAIKQTDVPVTGDITGIGMWIALFGVSGVVLWIALWIERKNRRRMLDEISETIR